jgi:hypothetical protein
MIWCPHPGEEILAISQHNGETQKGTGHVQEVKCVA